MKLVERKIERIHSEWHKLTRGFTQEVINWVISTIQKCIGKDELSSEQYNQLLIYIRKVLLEKYKIYRL